MINVPPLYSGLISDNSFDINDLFFRLDETSMISSMPSNSSSSSSSNSLFFDLLSSCSLPGNKNDVC